MARSPRKEREIREREELILDVARHILVEEGFSELTMDRIAAEIEYSKGTVYQHFASKEDVLAGLTLKTNEARIALFERAATFQGTARERVMAIGVADDLFVKLYPSHFRAEQIILLTSDPASVAGKRVSQGLSSEERCYQIVSGIVRDGIASGDLPLNPPHTVESLTFAMWSFSFGIHYLGGVLERFNGLDFGGDQFMVLCLNMNAMLDGIGFAPLSAAHDYSGTIERVRNEVFSEEVSRLDNA